MRILITGGLGFIGGRLAVHLARSGHEIVIGSRTKHDVSAWLPEAENYQMNWDSAENILAACTNVDVVVHAAGMNSFDCEVDPIAALQFNGHATEKLAQAAAHCKVKTFIYLSTAHVYASPLAGIVNEHTTPRNLHPYATSHLVGESAVLKVSQNNGMEGIILRISNVYGAPTHVDVNSWGLLVNELCRQAVTSREMVIRSYPSLQRNFLTMSDVCSVIQLFIENRQGVRFPNIMNIGSQKSETINEMATLIQKRCTEVFGTNPKIVYLSNESNQITPDLDFVSLHSSFFSKEMKNQRNDEIDSLIKFCDESFILDSE